MSIERLQSHYGFTRMPFGRGLAPAMLHRHPGHAEAVARINWCVDQHAIGVITGEVGAGKTVAIRAAIYLPNPSVGIRGMLHHVVGTLRRVPSFYTATLAPQAAGALAAEHAERGRTPVVVIDEAHLLDNSQMEAVRTLTNHDIPAGQSAYSCRLPAPGEMSPQLAAPDTLRNFGPRPGRSSERLNLGTNRPGCTRDRASKGESRIRQLLTTDTKCCGAIRSL